MKPFQNVKLILQSLKMQTRFYLTISMKLKDSVRQMPNTLVGNTLKLWVFLRQCRKKI